LRDRTRPSRKKPLSAEVKLKVLRMTANETPPNATHWSTRGMAKAVGISHNSVQRIWAEAGLKPHLVRTFKVSNDPRFTEKSLPPRRRIRANLTWERSDNAVFSAVRGYGVLVRRRSEAGLSA
jgi:hypothetical protein